jgi:hypothetical protein
VGVKAAKHWLIKTLRWAEQQSELVRVKVQGVRKVVKQLLITTLHNLFLFIILYHFIF